MDVSKFMVSFFLTFVVLSFFNFLFFCDLSKKLRISCMEKIAENAKSSGIHCLFYKADTLFFENASSNAE